MTLAVLATLVIWGALAGAQAELAARAVVFATQNVLVSNFYINPMAIAVGPAVNLPIFAIAVLLAVLVGRMLRPPRTFESVVFVVLTLVAYEVALVTWRIHAAALLLLAAGCASVVTRIVARFPFGSLRFARITAVLMAVVAAGGGVYLAMQPSLIEKRALRGTALPPAGSPNVVILILDTVRAIELGMYGNDRPVTPHLDSLARNAIRFQKAYATASWTLPSHTSMLTGRYAHEVSSNWFKPYDGQFPLLSEVLRDRGYATAAFAGNFVYLQKRWGLDRGFIRYEEYQVDRSALATTSNLSKAIVGLLNTEARHRIHVYGPNASVLRGRFARWQRTVGDRPFFALVNLFDAHAPYGAVAPYDTMFLGRRPRFYDIANWKQRDSIENSELHSAYQQAIASLDAQVGALVADLRQRGVLDRTFLVITSDHGEEFGEHGFSGHGGGLFATQTRVPLLVIPPGWNGAFAVDDDVTLRDLAATIAEATQLSKGTFPGTSLSRYWVPNKPAPDEPSPILSEVGQGPLLEPWYQAARGSLRSIVQDSLSYTRLLGDSGTEWLFDLASDPLERVDLSHHPAYAGRLARLRAAMDHAVSQTAPSRSP